ALNSINEALNSINEALNSVNEALNSINEALREINESLILLASQSSMPNAPCQFPFKLFALVVAG
nr:hypothetical protein [Nostoc sp. CreGUA01]